MENNLKIEEWTIMQSHDYEISNYGYIRKVGKFQKNKFSISNSGYKVYHLYKNGVRTHFYAHILVATHFIPNPEYKKVVNHKDGDKMNCYFKNLEWSTSSENNSHAYQNNLKTSTKGVNKSDSKLTDDDVRMIRETIGILSNSEAATKFSISRTVISNIRTNKAWKHVI